MRVEAADVRRAVSLLPLVPRPPEPRRTARNRWIARCAFHEDSRPSMSVSLVDAGWVFNCFSCGEHGDVISYVMKLEGIDFKAALARLAPQGGQLPQLSPPHKGYLVPCLSAGCGALLEANRSDIDEWHHRGAPGGWWVRRVGGDVLALCSEHQPARVRNRHLAAEVLRRIWDFYAAAERAARRQAA